MKSNKAIILLGLLCAFVLLVSSVVADQTPQDETKVDEAKESKPYGQGGKSCRWQGGCCRWSKRGYGCLQCCHPSEIKADAEKLCERASLTWTGKCGNTQHCDKQCQTWEGAAHGACHNRGNWKCFCYFNC